MDQVQQIVASLPGLDRVTGLHEVADRRLAAGDPGFVADLGIALYRAYGTEDRPIWQFRSFSDYLLRLLTVTPGRPNVEQALRLAAGAGGRRQARYVASLLAAGQAPGDLAGVFAGGSGSGGSEELRACLVHEMVLRGAAIEDQPGIAGWATSPHWSHHPLRWLPLIRAAAEQEPLLPRYNARGSVVSWPGGGADGAAAPRGTVPGTATEITTPEAAAAVAAATQNWADDSNGRIEARIFQLGGPTGPVPGTLAGLGLDCLAGLGRRDGLTVSVCPVPRAWQILFSAAASGGAYGHGLYGAYGRLAAWRSLAAMAGPGDGASFGEVERQVDDCAWYSFDAPTRWFEHVVWDIGLAAVTPDGRRLAVLAATDTD